MSSEPVVDKPAEPARSARRAPGEVRELLLEAAEEMFCSHGFDYSSTKRIAERAGVAEVLLFRHFGSKAQLFREAVVEPMVSALRQYSDQWYGYDRSYAAKRPVHDFVEMFFGTLSQRRGSAFALTAASNYSSGVLEDAGAPLADVLQAVEQVVVQEVARFGYEGLNPPITARVGVGSVLAAAVFRGWLFGQGADVADAAAARELEALLMHGVRNRPEQASG
jgi:AcrR family transcriptional regulator